jgi:hypothetical protein
MKTRPIRKPTEELKAKCNADDQFNRFDRVFRAVIAVPKFAMLKQEAKHKRRKKKRAQTRSCRKYFLFAD